MLAYSSVEENDSLNMAANLGNEVTFNSEVTSSNRADFLNNLVYNIDESTTSLVNSIFSSTTALNEFNNNHSSYFSST